MKTVVSNRRARFDYEITETVLAGILLTGGEAKACREGHVDLAGAYVSFLGGAPVLKHMKIPPYRYADPAAHVPERDRALLLKKSEGERLRRESELKGMTIVPLEVQAGRFIKVLLGLGRGRKRFDKRQRIKERETGRRIREGREV